MIKGNYRKHLSIILCLVGIHSFAIGVVLLIIPSSILNTLGFIDYKENFFQAQGGAFHLAMSVCYFMASIDVSKSVKLIQFTIAVKFIAFVFLILYFVFFWSSWLLVISAFTDGMMGVIIIILYHQCKFEVE